MNEDAGRNGAGGAGVSSDGFSSQVESAFSELMRLQQDLQERLRALSQREAAVQERSAEVAQREHDLDRRQSELQDDVSRAAVMAAKLDECEQQARARDRDLSVARADLSRLEDRQRALVVAETKLAERDVELQEVVAQLRERERELATLEAKLAEAQVADAELNRREDECRRRREDVEARTALLESLEREAAARDAVLCRRELAVETVCAMLATTASALADPKPDNVAAAAAAANAAFEAQRACHSASVAARQATTRGATPRAAGATGFGALDAPRDDAPGAASAFDSAPREVAGAVSDCVPGDVDDDQLDVSDFSPEEMQRLRMLRLLGTASAAEIVAMIRDERATADVKPRKKRLGLF